ncbi:MAG: hypothetical protein V1744_07045 [Candidatus Altiarchaeota archaeon]
MEKLNSLVSRIRWKSVIAVILLVAVAYTLIQYFPGGYQTSGNIGLKVSAKPDSMTPGGSTTLEVEVKNMNSKEEVTVTIRGRTFEKEIMFADTQTQNYASDPIQIGPQGVRKLSLSVKSSRAALEGEYPVEVTVSAEGVDKPPEKMVLIKVERPS